MREAPQVRVVVYHKEIFGDCLPGSTYKDDSLMAVRDFLSDLLASKIPIEYHSTANFAIDSVGGYEGEHHAELTIYYERPETDDERKNRLAEEHQRNAEEERRERAALAKLKNKYG